MLQDITWILKYVIILINFYILYILYQKKKKTREQRKDENKNKQILLLTAHPDDEMMFFYPLIKYLKSEGFGIHVLCMTYGQLGAEKASETRKREFEKVMKSLSLSNYKIVNEARLLDSMYVEWNMKIIGEVVDEYVEQHKINCIFSFDEFGVSGHCNHCSLAHFLNTKLQDYKKKEIKIYMLESVNLLRKYFIPLDILCILLLEIVNVFGIIIKGKEIYDFFIFFNFDFR